VSVVVGLLIGSVGIGGVLLIPGLVAFGAIPLHAASATALFTFIFTGLLSAWLFARRGSIDWRASATVCVAALVFSYVGAYINSVTQAAVLSRIIGAVIVLAGANVLHPLRQIAEPVNRSLRMPILAGVGALAGFGSGLTGAGGPLFSVPMMLALGFPPLMTIGVSQVLQIVSATSGTLGNLAYGTIDWRTAALVTPFELAGVAIGVVIAHRAQLRHLRMLAGWLCLVAGALVLVRGA
jgi:uncharacterized membrane protein YfcA